MADVIGSVRVVLGADTASFETGLKKAESELSKFAKQMATIASGIAFERHLTAAIQAVVGSFKDMIVEADKMGKAAQKIGIPVEELSKLKYAADLSDVSFETLSRSVGMLSRNMLAAQKDATTPFGDAMRALGVKTEGSNKQLRSSNDVIADLAGKFSGMRDGAAKTALAMAIFGRAGAEMIPLLNEGKDSLKKFGDEAVIFDTKFTNSAQQLLDNLKRLGNETNKLIVLIIGSSGMLEVMVRVSEVMIEAAKSTDKFSIVATALTPVLRYVQSVTMVLNESMMQLGRGLVAVAEAAGLLATGNFSAAWDRLKLAAEDTRISTDKLAFSLQQMWSAAAVPVGTSGGTPDKIIEDILNPPSGRGGADPPIVTSLKKVGDQQRQVMALWKQMDEEARTIMESVREPWEKLNEEVEKINGAFARGILTQEQFGLASERIAKKTAETWAMGWANVAQSFSSVFAQFAGKNKALFRASKALSIAEAIINTYVAANKGLATYGPTPLGFAAAAAAIAMGLANVAKISAQEPPSFATGGSFKVGGVGGIDSKRVSMNVSPGEMVDIKKGDGGMGSTELVIPSIRPRDFFTGETVREMVMAIDRWSRDGGTGIRFAT